jgi:hypothetical protein
VKILLVEFWKHIGRKKEEKVSSKINWYKLLSISKREAKMNKAPRTERQHKVAQRSVFGVLKKGNLEQDEIILSQMNWEL